MNENVTILKFFVIFIFVFVIMAMLSGSGTDDSTTVADGFEIDAYDVTLDVAENNVVSVTETITVDFTECEKHGIYKFTPLWFKYTPKDGKTISRKAKISDYRAIGDEYSLDTVKKKARIKIGSASSYVGCGPKIYTIKYLYDMGSDPFKGFDEFIFHAYGDYWGTEIKNATINVIMPKSIEGYNVNFFMDKYRGSDVTRFVNYSVNNNRLTAKFNSEKYKSYLPDADCSSSIDVDNDECISTYYTGGGLDKSLTVDIELPEGYFAKGSWNYGFKSLISSIVVIVLTMITIITWYRYGKNFAKRSKTVEFYPPDNLNSAEIGYVFNKNQTNKKLSVSLIVQLASKGYIKIDEINDKKKDIQITNLIKFARKPADFQNMLGNRIIEVQKIKNADNYLNEDESYMMSYLFHSSNFRKLTTSIDKFLAVRDNLVNKGYIKVVSDNENELMANFDEKKAEYDRLVAEYNTNLANSEKMLAKLQPLSYLEQVVYEKLFEYSDVIILSEHETFYQVFNTIDSQLSGNFNDKIHDSVASSKIIGAVLRMFLVLTISVISYSFFEDLDPKLYILYYISFGCIFVNLFFALFMKRKTEYGEMIIAKVQGFKDFLVTVEKDKLEKLVSENPHYFYDILPYTYVLNISKKWISKFENIPMPKMDMGTFDYGNDSAYSSLYDTVSWPAPSFSSSGGGCSSCGGGCSSCGGGCSSCGGGGSW